MDYNMKSVAEILEINQIVSARMNCRADRWLDIAFKLDYITLAEKERISSLILKYSDTVRYNTHCKFCKKNYHELNRMKQIIKNTIIPECCIRAVT